MLHGVNSPRIFRSLRLTLISMNKLLSRIKSLFEKQALPDFDQSIKLIYSVFPVFDFFLREIIIATPMYHNLSDLCK